MKKAIIIGVAVLVLFGCILSAGCTFGDPIVGVWKLTEPTEEGVQETEGYDTYMTFIGNGIGYQNFYAEGEEYDATDNSSSYSAGSSSSSYSVGWTKLSDGTYYLTFPTADVTATLDTTKTKLTTNWGTYTKVKA